MQVTEYRLAENERGCGYLVAGGTYLVLPVGPGGMPLEHFMFCPPLHQVDVDGTGDWQPIKEAFNLAPKGVRMVQMGGTWHVVDQLGLTHYKNAADYLEECRRMGPCRRAEGIQYELLDEHSRLLMAHPRGYITNAHEYYLQTPAGAVGCPKDHKHHHPDVGLEMCTALFWQDLERGAGAVTVVDQPNPRLVERAMPSFKYVGYTNPPDVEPRYQLALIAAFPIGHIRVVADHEGRTHEAKVRDLQERGVQLPVGISHVLNRQPRLPRD